MATPLALDALCSQAWPLRRLDAGAADLYRAARNAEGVDEMRGSPGAAT